MIENEDKWPKTIWKEYENWKLSNSWKYVLNIYNNLKKILEALLLEYTGFTQYEFHFWK